MHISNLHVTVANTQNHNADEDIHTAICEGMFFCTRSHDEEHLVLNDMLKRRNDDMHETGAVGLPQN